MLRVLDGGAVLFITPDGPRGPMHSMNPGLAWMARATGRAVIPSAFVCDRAWPANSWDNFTLPKPFARILLIYGEPLSVPRGADEAAQEEATAEVPHEAFAAILSELLVVVVVVVV